uniref:Uncharacterized protein n=1 Tax=Anguilla anguilla TaxID=7936 RepID=A0A0E9WLY2_ANGAN
MTVTEIRTCTIGRFVGATCLITAVLNTALSFRICNCRFSHHVPTRGRNWRCPLWGSWGFFLSDQHRIY